MIAQRIPCPNEEELLELLSGKLLPANFEVAIEHVESCEHCQLTIQNQAYPSELSWLRKPSNESIAPRFEIEPECQAIVAQLLMQPNKRTTHQNGLGKDKTLLPKSTLGPYRLIRALGAGGMGAVYLAEHERLKRRVAIKLLDRDKLLRHGWLDRFNREMTAIAALEHPNIVRATDAGEEDQWHFLVMEYLEGLDLGKICRRVPEIPIGVACEMIRQAALGLDAIHNAGMVHRDIKPSNLFLTENSQVKILDLGLVLDGDSPLAADERLTTIGHMMGTVPYMSREQLNDPRQADHRADIYSLGATLFRLLAKSPPFGVQRNLAKTIQAIGASEAPSIGSVRKDLPTEIVNLIDRMLSVDPEKRPQLATEIAAEVKAFCDSSGLKSTLRTAVNSASDEDDTPTGLSNLVAKPAMMGRSIPRVPFWIAVCLLPLAFAAGIFLTITTDRGTLVIQSDDASVSVKITQGETVVEQFEIEQTQPATLKLKSGRYTIELTGVESDKLKVSDQQVSLMRNDRQVVQITRKDAASVLTPPLTQTRAGSVSDGQDDISPSLPTSMIQAPVSSKTGPTAQETARTDTKYFQGKTLDDWMQVLQQDQDVESIGQAMRAVSTLAESHGRKLTAARAFLVHARRLGGYSAGNSELKFSKVPTSQEYSEYFMRELQETYVSFFPHAGFEAIVDELNENSDSSSAACAFLLLLFSSQQTTYEPLGSKHFEELHRTESGNTILQRADARLRNLIDQQAIIVGKSNDDSNMPRAATYRDVAVFVRVQLLIAMSKNVASDEQLLKWGRDRMEQAQIAYENRDEFRNSQRSNSNSWLLTDFATISVGRILGTDGYDVRPIVYELLSMPNVVTKNSEFMKLVVNLARSNPASFAEAVEAYLREQRLVPIAKQDSILDIGLKTFAESHPRVLEAVGTCAIIVSGNHRLDAKNPLLAEAINRVLARLVLETDVKTDENAVAKLAFAAIAFTFRDIPPDCAEDVLTVLLNQYDASNNFQGRAKTFDRSTDWTDINIRQIDKTNKILDQTALNVYSRKALLRNPKAGMAVATRLILEGEIPLRVIYYDLISTLCFLTEPDLRIRKADTDNVNENLKAYLQTDDGRTVIKQLAAGYDELLKRLSDVPIDKAIKKADDEPFQELLVQRLNLAKYLKEDAAKNSVIVNAITFLNENDIEYRSLAILEVAGEIFGYQNMDLTRLPKLVRYTYSHEHIGPRVLKKLYESQNGQFPAHVMGFLGGLLDRDTEEDVNNNVSGFFHQLGYYGQPPKEKNLWHAIVKRLREDPKHQQAIEKLVKGLSEAVSDKRIAEAILNPLGDTP